MAAAPQAVAIEINGNASGRGILLCCGRCWKWGGAMNKRLNKIRWRPSGAADGKNDRPSYLVSTARTLLEACCETGLDQHGRRCPDCPVADLCADESRWLVRRTRWAN
jgi:hypothetical protein